MARGVNYHSGSTVNDVPGRHLIFPWLQEILERHRSSRFGNPPVNGENGPHGNVYIDVGGTIQRIDQHHIFVVVLLVAPLDGDKVILFLTGYAAHNFPVGKGFDEGVVGIHIKFLLIFALYIRISGRAQNIHQACFVHFMVHYLGGKTNGVDES